MKASQANLLSLATDLCFLASVCLWLLLGVGCQSAPKESVAGLQNTNAQPMTFYLMKGRYSAEAVQKISGERTGLAHQIVQQNDGKIVAAYATLGQDDLLVITEFPGVSNVMKASMELNKALGISFASTAALSVDDFDKLVCGKSADLVANAQAKPAATDQGTPKTTFLMAGRYSAEAVKQISAERSGLASQIVGQCGGRIVDGYATLGDNDLLMVMEFPGVSNVMKASIELNKALGISFASTAALPVDDFDKLFAKPPAAGSGQP